MFILKTTEEQLKDQLAEQYQRQQFAKRMLESNESYSTPVLKQTCRLSLADAERSIAEIKTRLNQ